MKLEVIDFNSKIFSDIPKQDNPAYADDECVLICKAQDDQTGCYVVMKIDKGQSKIDEIQQLGLFWTIESAILFSKVVTPNNNLTPEIKKEDEVTWSNAGWWQLPLV